jgi:hypothetical protein
VKISQILANIEVDRNDTGLPLINVEEATFTNLLQVVLGIAGAIAFLVIVLGGLYYVISQGNPQATEKAKDTILYALIGLVVCVSAFAIIEFVIKGVT